MSDNAALHIQSAQQPENILQNTDLDFLPLWTVEDVARYLRVNAETVRSMARRGDLPAIKVGRGWRFSQSALHQFINKEKEGGA